MSSFLHVPVLNLQARGLSADWMEFFFFYMSKSSLVNLWLDLSNVSKMIKDSVKISLVFSSIADNFT